MSLCFNLVCHRIACSDGGSEDSEGRERSDRKDTP